MLLAAVSEVLFRHDPIGIAFESNADEYDGEAQTIVIRAIEGPPRLSEADLVDVVHGEFVQWFNSEIAGPRAAYIGIASELRALGLV